MMRNKLLKKVFVLILITTVAALVLVPNSIVRAVEDGDATKVVGDFEEVVMEIEIPRYNDSFQYEPQQISAVLKGRLDSTNEIGWMNGKTLRLDDIQLYNVYLDSAYLNGVGTQPVGTSYYNMLNFYIDVLQVKQMLDANPIVEEIYDSKSNLVSVDYVNKLLDLLDQINKFDPTTKLKYDYNSVYDASEFASNEQLGGVDVIATHRLDANVTFKFHIDAHGYWGYDMARDSIAEVVTGAKGAKYANFFVIEMQNKAAGKWYMLNDTDLQNPIIYVSADGKEAFMIDVDNYAENVINNVIKSVIGDKCEKLTILITHNHPDHVNNLDTIAKDPYLSSISTIMYPKNENANAKVTAAATKFGTEVKYISDMERFTAAGVEFQFIEIPEEHTKGGGQVADLTNKILHSGDTLGSQIHLGGTSMSLSAIDNWISGIKKTEEYISDNKIEYLITGHNPYLNTPEFASWVRIILEYAKDQWEADPSWKAGLVIVENGKIVTDSRLSEMMSTGLSDRDVLKVASVNVTNNVVRGSYDEAVNEIIIPKYEADGSKTNQKVSDILKGYLDITDLTAVKSKNTLTFKDVQLMDVYLDSAYLNGVGGPDVPPVGTSYFNMLNFYTDVKQVKQLLEANPGLSATDSKGAVVDLEYVNELLGLLDQINDFDPTTNLEYDYDSVYNSPVFALNEKIGGFDVIATSKEGNIKFKFHIDSHGYWGYDVGAHDSINGIVMGFDEEYSYDNQRELATKYGNFFVIKMKSDSNGTWYVLNDTDLQNPVLYVSADGTEAFMIDVDFYGENVINEVIKSVIGDRCGELTILLTHSHLDHVNNLKVIAKDPVLGKMLTIMYPENEATNKIVNEVVDTTGAKIKYVSDMEKFTAAGFDFQFIEIPEEHTTGGGQVADLTNKILHSGDTLGSQIHLGGTTVSVSALDSWISGLKKTEKYISDNKIEYIIAGHNPYLNTPEFASWIRVALEYAKKQVVANPSWKAGLVVVENGEVVTGDRLGEMFSKGLSDRDVLNVASVNFRNNITPIDPGNPNPVEPGGAVSTGDNNLFMIYSILGISALVIGLVISKKKDKDIYLNK